MNIYPNLLDFFCISYFFIYINSRCSNGKKCWLLQSFWFWVRHYGILLSLYKVPQAYLPISKWLTCHTMDPCDNDTLTQKIIIQNGSTLVLGQSFLFVRSDDDNDDCSISMSIHCRVLYYPLPSTTIVHCITKNCFHFSFKQTNFWYTFTFRIM